MERSKRSLITVGLLAILVVASVSSCGSSASDSQAAPRTTSPEQVTGRTNAVRVSTATTLVVKGLELCSDSEIEVSVGEPDGGMSRSHYDINFRNAGSGPCILNGHPKVRMYDEAGRILGSASVPDVPAQPVRVDRGDVALSRLTVLSPQLFCDPSTELIKSPTLGITAPGASVERQFQIPENICREAISSAASVDSVTVQRRLPTPDQQVVARTAEPGFK